MFLSNDMKDRIKRHGQPYITPENATRGQNILQYSPPAPAPNLTPGLVGWWDFADPLTLYTTAARTTPVFNDGDLIGSADNKAIANQPAAQSVDARRLIYKKGLYNGLSIARAVAASGTALIAPYNALYNTPSISVFVVALLSATGFSVVARDNGATRLWKVGGNASGANWFSENFGAGVVSDGPWSSFCLFEFIYSNAQFHRNYKNRVLQNNNVVGGPLNTSAAIGLAIGARVDFAEPMNADIGEVVIYDRALSDSDRENVEDYLMLKWNLS